MAMVKPKYVFEDDGPVELLLLCTECSALGPTSQGNERAPWWATWSVDSEGVSADGLRVARKSRMLMETHNADRHADDDGA